MNLIKILFISSILMTQASFGVSIVLDGTKNIISGSDCSTATYRFGTTTSYNGDNLDVLLYVTAEDNEYIGGSCVDTQDGVVSFHIRDRDDSNNVASMDLQFIVVKHNTFTPVNVDTLTVTNFDLDSNGNSDYTLTDDVYYKNPLQTLISNDSEVLNISGDFYDEYTVKLRGKNNGNCNDSATLTELSCRAGAIWKNSSTVYARVQNDNAYGSYNWRSEYHRLLQFSFEYKDIAPLISENNTSKECGTYSYSTNSDSWVEGTTHSQYNNSLNIQKNISIPTASQLKISFNGVTEEDYDYLYIIEENGIEHEYSGNLNNLNDLIIDGSSVTMKFTSDSSVIREGVTVTVESLGCGEPTISLTDSAEIIEGNSGTSDLIFPINLSKPAGKDILLHYEITDINTTANEDYILENNLTILIPKDANSSSIVVKVKGDTDVEADESFSLKLVDATNAIVDSSSVVGMIINDDELPLYPIAEYRFDACSWHSVLGEVKDSSENGNHLNAINGVQTIDNGAVLRALNVNDSNQRVQGDTNLTFSDELTLNAWIKTTTNQAVGGAYTRVVEFSKTGTSAYSTDLAYMPDGKTIRGWTSNGENTRSTEVRYNLEDNGFYDGAWHLLSYTYNKGVAKLYVDGELKQTTTKDIGNLADPKKISIGGYYNSSAYRFTGAIDEVTIFDKALSLDEINVLKNNSNLNRQPLDCNTVQDITGTVFQDENRNNVFDAVADVSLRDVKVELFRDTNSDGLYDNLDTLLDNKNSDINGNFAFTNLTSGYYLLIVDENDSNIPQTYTLNTSRVISIHIVNGNSEHNYFAFSKETALPVGCVGNALMFQNAPTDISYLDLSNGNMFVKAEDVTPGNVNGAGFNKKDGYFWGFNHTIKNGTLSRVGKNSEGDLMVDHFAIPNLILNSYTGDIDDNGHLYLKENGTTKVAVIDLDPSSNTYLTKLRNFTLGENLSIADWAFNPQDDKLYAVTSTYLYKIEPSDGHILTVQDVNVTGSGAYGASFFDKDGNYYIYRNNSGEIFRIDVAAEHPQAIPFSQGGVVSSNDGAMCTDVDIRFDFGDLPFATTLAQDGARHRIRTSEGETHYLGADVDTENDGEASITADRDDYDDGVTVNGSTLQNFMITRKSDLSNIHVVTHGNGYLNAWIDWNRDGDFNASEQIANGVNSSSGTIDLKLNDIPNILFNGEPIYARFRYSSQQELNATGVAPDGEVEDYAMGTANYPTLIIDNVTQNEGDNETKNFTFHLSLSSISEYVGSFSFATEDGTATTADNDYISNSDTIAFDIGSQDLGNIVIQVNGDTNIEPNEIFYLKFSSPFYLNILSKGVGTIVNDDAPKLSIERKNSDTVDNDTEKNRKSFYTQISGRDFDYAIVSYEGENPYAIEDTTVKVELIDENSTTPNDVIYGATYLHLSDEHSRFNISALHDLEIQHATRDAVFKISYLLDENGTILQGQYDNEVEYNLTKSSNNNQETSGYSDDFAIRPASYRIEINDLDENNQTVTYATNNNQDQELKLAAEYDYNLRAYAVIEGNNNTATDYKTLSSKELNVTLDFDETHTTHCADTNTSEITNYNFQEGALNENFSHNNVGKYTLHIEDINWTYIDKNETNLGCIIGSSSNVANSTTGKFGCNIASNEGNDFRDLNMTFQPYSFELNNTFSNIHNNKNYLYMSDLNLSREMGVKLSSTIKAVGKQGTVLSNFTNGCIEENPNLTLKLKFEFEDDRGTWNDTNMTLPKSADGKEDLKPQQIVAFNDNNISELNMTIIKNIIIKKEEFKDENNGSMSVNIFYNMQKLFDEPTNPIKVNFLSLDLNTSNLEAKLEGEEKAPSGKRDINEERIFYFARIASYLEHYPKTNKKSISTPLFLEVYCKRSTPTQDWCRDTMNLTVNGMTSNGQKTYKGWYLATGHDSATEGSVLELSNISSSDSDKINTNHTTNIPPFVNGIISDIRTVYVSDDKLEEKITAEIDIDTDVWLTFNKNNGNASYFVTIAPIGGMTGVDATEDGELGYNLMRKKDGSLNGMVEKNGKMSW